MLEYVKQSHAHVRKLCLKPYEICWIQRIRRIQWILKNDFPDPLDSTDRVNKTDLLNTLGLLL